MYKKPEKKNNVTGIKAFDDHLYYTIGNKLKLKQDLIIQGVEGHSFWFINDGVYFHDLEGNRFFRKRNINHLIDSPFFIGTDFGPNILCKTNFRRENRKWKWKLGVFDIEALGLREELSFENYTAAMIVDKIAIGYFESNRISGLDIDQKKNEVGDRQAIQKNTRTLS